MCRPVLQILTRSQTKKCFFPDSFSDQTSKIHARFQTWSLAEIILSLLTCRLERKQTNSSNPFRIRILLFISYSFGIETINTFIHSCSSLENHNRFQTKTGKVLHVFRPKRRRHPTRWGAHTYIAYIREYPPGRKTDPIVHLKKFNRQLRFKGFQELRTATIK